VSVCDGGDCFVEERRGEERRVFYFEEQEGRRRGEEGRKMDFMVLNY